MSILREYLAFESEKDNYTQDERDKIEKSFKARAKRILSKASQTLIDAIDDINNV